MLLDTNILIALFNSNDLVLPEVQDRFSISVITEAELLRYSGIGDNEVALLIQLMDTMNVLSIDSAIARTAAQLGRTRKTKLPDLLIAATALEYNTILVTKNLKDFQNIPKLRIQDTLS